MFYPLKFSRSYSLTQSTLYAVCCDAFDAWCWLQLCLLRTSEWAKWWNGKCRVYGNGKKATLCLKHFLSLSLSLRALHCKLKFTSSSSSSTLDGSGLQVAARVLRNHNKWKKKKKKKWKVSASDETPNKIRRRTHFRAMCTSQFTSLHWKSCEWNPMPRLFASIVRLALINFSHQQINSLSVFGGCSSSSFHSFI